MADYERDENLKLWQDLTSDRIPLEDIREAVYIDSREIFQDHTAFMPEETDNRFYIYLNNTHDDDITDFLGTAKYLEELWAETRSPWYYPQDRNLHYDTPDYGDITEYCKSYDGKKLKDRYALQATRALFASRRYAECIEYTDSAFAGFPDTNLMKRMARRYAAGCHVRLGDRQKADSLFAMTGDVWSISKENAVELMAALNPDAPQLMDYIRSNTSDTLMMKKLIPIAERLLKENRIRHKGDWNFLLAYVYNESHNRSSAARTKIYRAISQQFSSEELRDMARSYKMKLDAQAGNRQNLLSDLKWIESRIDPVDRTSDKWIRICRNVIYADWVPRLWKEKDHSTAILLCSYADNLDTAERYYNQSDYTNGRSPVKSITINDIRNSEKHINDLDYGCLSFQLMGSLSSARLSSAYKQIMRDNPLYNFLRHRARTDSDYYNELTGTLALREENYPRAIAYLSKVSEHYLKTMNIDKEGYLSRDPFKPYRSRWSSHGDSKWEYEHSTIRNHYESRCDAKLTFARAMQKYRHEMRFAATPDERGLARLMYAIGRRNSFEECWALTQYWRGEHCGKFEPMLQYWENEFKDKHYGFLYDYNTTVGHKATEKLYEDEKAASLAMLASDEAKAKAHYILGNLPTVVRKYGNTTSAQIIKTSCDNWESWL